MADLLFDTDVLIDHLRGSERIELSPNTRPGYSVVTRAELLAGPAAQEEVVLELLGAMGEIEVDRRIADAAGRIRRDTRVAMPDALIAATALVAGIPLRTRNRRDFERIDGLLLD